MNTGFENPTNNMTNNNGGIKEKLDSLDSKLTDINTKFDVAIKILNEIKEKNQKKEEPLVTEKIDEEVNNELPTIEPIVSELPVVEEKVSELPKIENTVESNVEIPIIPEINTDNNEEVVSENNNEIPEINTDVKEETSENNVISIGDLLNNVNDEKAVTPTINNVEEQKTEQIPIIPEINNNVVNENLVAQPQINISTENVDPVVAPIVSEEKSMPELQISTEPQINNEVVADNSIPMSISNESAQVQSNVEKLNFDITEAIGDGRQRSIVTSETNHNNLMNKEKTLSLAA